MAQEQLPNYATNIALISNGIVQNTIWGAIYQIDEYEALGYTAIPFNDLFVTIGDSYTNGHFYHDGVLSQTVTQYYENELAELEDFIIDELYNEIIENAEDLL